MINYSDLTLEHYRIGQIADLLGVTAQTIDKYMNEGLLEYYHLPNSSHRRVTKGALIDYLETYNLLDDDREVDRMDVIYARVPTKEREERGKLEDQINQVKLFVVDKSPKDLKIITDVASGMDESRPGLQELLQMVHDKKVNRIFIMSKDRLTRFGYQYLEQLCKWNQTELVVMTHDSVNQNFKEEVQEDADFIFAVFRDAFHGERTEEALFNEWKRQEMEYHESEYRENGTWDDLVAKTYKG